MSLEARCQTLRPGRDSGWLVFFELVKESNRQGHFFAVGPAPGASPDAVRVSLTAGQAAVRYFKEMEATTLPEIVLEGAADLIRDHARRSGTHLEFGCGVLEGPNLWFLTQGNVRLLNLHKTETEPVEAPEVMSLGLSREDRFFFGHLSKDKDKAEVLAEHSGGEGGLILSFQSVSQAEEIPARPAPGKPKHPSDDSRPKTPKPQPPRGVPVAASIVRPVPDPTPETSKQSAATPGDGLRRLQELPAQEESRGLLFWLGLVVFGVSSVLLVMYILVWREPVQEVLETLSQEVTEPSSPVSAHTPLGQAPWNINEIWTATFKRALTSTPRVGKGGVVFGCRDGTVNCYAFDTGVRKWAYASSQGFGSSPAAVGDLLIIGSYDGSIYGLNAMSGEAAWVVKTGGRIVASPAIYKDIAFIGSYDKHLYALDVSTGSVRWRVDLGGVQWASPAVEGKLVIAAGLDGGIHALEVQTGAVRWSVKTQAPIYSSPVVAERKVFIGSEDGHVYALELETGEEIWKIQAPDKVNGSPGYHEGRLVVGVDDGTVLGIDVGLGTVVWSAKTDGRVRSKPSFYQGLVWVTSYDANLWGFDLLTGQVVVKYPMSASMYASPLIHDGYLYVGSMDGVFSALHLIHQ